MNSRLETPVSKGLMLIAAYRAERLNQRPFLKKVRQQKHIALREEKDSTVRRETVGESLIAECNTVRSKIDVAEAIDSKLAPFGSIFAGYIADYGEGVTLPSSVDLTRQAVNFLPEEGVPTPDKKELGIKAPYNPTPEDQGQCNTDSASAISPNPSLPSPTDTLCPPFDPPLAEIGFGPGMLIRLSQIGMHTTSDLASSNVGELRAALGDISRLVDVAAWIDSAKKKLGG